MTRGRRLAWLALAVGVVVVLAVALWPRGGTPSVAARTRSLASDLRCVDCEGLSVADSSTASARQTRADIAARLHSGQSEDEIRQVYVDRYGESILLNPEQSGLGLVVWGLPVLFVVLAGAGLVVAFRRWHRATPMTATEADEALVRSVRGSALDGAEQQPDRQPDQQPDQRLDQR